MKILIVDDENLLRISLRKALEKKGIAALEAKNLKEAKEIIVNEEPDLVLLDINLPDGSGLEILDWAKNSFPFMQFIMITAYGKIKDAVEAIKKGAFHYLEKPFEMEELFAYIERIKEYLNLKKEVLKFEKFEEGKKTQIIAKSPKMFEVLKTAHIAAKSNVKIILITGESGTGKELIAKYINEHSDKYNFSFLSINCATIPENLLEAELFGYEKGAFTDAKNQKKGIIELANGGTLFLDEIGELKFNLQAKLLRILESGQFKRIGGIRDINFDVRFITATNQDLKKKVEEKAFREDLYYRLALFPIHIPPLRERKEDILPICEYFIKIYNKKFGKDVLGLSKNASQILLNYHWPGNIRELKNLIERAMILQSGDFIEEKDLNIQIDYEKNNIEKFHSLEEAELSIIKDALKNAKGNVSKAAKILKISRDKLRYKIKKHNLISFIGKIKE